MTSSERPAEDLLQRPSGETGHVDGDDPAPLRSVSSPAAPNGRGGDEDRPVRMVTAVSTASDTVDAENADEDEPATGALSPPPDHLDEKFEDEFKKHLKKSNKKSRMKMGAVGVGLGAGLGILASPVLLPGLVIAGIAGGAGGYGWGKMKGLKRLARHAAGGSSAPAASATEADSRPTLRRLRFLVQWGLWQLLEYENAPAEWRAAVLSEVVRAFSPWVQAMFLVRARLGGGALEADAEAQEIFQHLFPLYQCVQRGAFFEAIIQACELVEATLADEATQDMHTELCRITFPTVLETVSIMDRLTPATHTKLNEAKEEKIASKDASNSSSSRKKDARMSEQIAIPAAVKREKGRQRLRQIVVAIRGVLERPDLDEALNKSSAPHALDCLQRAEESFKDLILDDDEDEDTFDTKPEEYSLITRPLSSHSIQSQSSDPCQDEAMTGQTTPVHNPNRVPLIVPPEGAEEEADEKAFHSCSEDEDAPSRPTSPSSSLGATSPDSSLSSPGPTAAADRFSKAGTAASSTQHTTGRFKDRLAAFPCGHGNHAWNPRPASCVDVRSATYLTDRKKAPSAPALLELMNVDFLKIPPSGPISHPATRRDFYPMEHRKQNDGRFLFIQNWIFPPYQALFVSALDPKAPWLTEDTPQARVWKRFLEGSLDEQKNSFKLLVSVEEGPWIVKRATPKKPVLIWRQLKMETRYEPGEYLEVTIDVSKSRADAMATALVMKSLTRIEVVIAMLIEGKTEDELPETLLVCAAMKGIDTSRVLCPDESWHWD